LNDSELKKLYTSLVDKGFVSQESREEDLSHVLGGSRPEGFKPIKWIRETNNNHNLSKKSVLNLLRYLEVDWEDLTLERLNYCFCVGSVPFKAKNFKNSRSGCKRKDARSEAKDDLYQVMSMVFGEDSERYKRIKMIPLRQNDP
jgi:hypothetical protein